MTEKKTSHRALPVAPMEPWSPPNNAELKYLLRAKTPLRVSFAGGGTDVQPYPREEGGVVLSATINKYVHGTLRPREDRNILIQSLDLNEAASMTLGDMAPRGDSLDLVRAAIGRVAKDAPNGFDLFLHSTAPPGSGLGASSAVVVTLIELLTKFLKQSLTNYEIASLAYEIEREDLGLSGGAQDQYAAVFGGFNFIEFIDDRVVVNPLRLEEETVRELEYSLLLCFSGKTRVSDHIIDDQTERFKQGNREAREGLRVQKELALEMRDLLLRGRLREFGLCLDTAWQAKKKLSPKITNPYIDKLYETALREGALGGKVTGAGGGGYLLLYCPYDRRHRVEAALQEYGVETLQFDFDSKGLISWSHRDD